LLLASDENFMVKFFTIEFFSSSWLLFYQFQLDKKPLHIKIEVCERNSCVCVIIATRDAVTEEERLESLNAKGKMMKVIDMYAVAVKKEGIIFGNSP